jgi:hypothetical protein
MAAASAEVNTATLTPTEKIIRFIEAKDVAIIRALPQLVWVEILSTIPDPQDKQRILFAKNIKIFGGINGYVNDFLSKGTIERIKSMPAGEMRSSTVNGAKHTLHLMASHAEISSENKDRIQAAMAELDNLRGGKRRGGKSQRISRKKRKATRKSKRRN